MSEFGDWEAEDSLDTEPADPEQVAILYAELEGGRWEDFTPEQRAARVAIFVTLLARLRREGSLR
jgi:hypothetical protein